MYGAIDQNHCCVLRNKSLIYMHSQLFQSCISIGEAPTNKTLSVTAPAGIEPERGRPVSSEGRRFVRPPTPHPQTLVVVVDGVAVVVVLVVVPRRRCCCCCCCCCCCVCCCWLLLWLLLLLLLALCLWICCLLLCCVVLCCVVLCCVVCGMVLRCFVLFR